MTASDRSGGRWIGDHAVFHGEGAWWDPRIGALRYVDMLAGDVVTLRGDAAERTDMGSDVAAVIRARRGGGYVVAVQRGFLILDDDLSLEREIAVFEDPSIRMNEGACDPSGRLFVGSMSYDARGGAGTLYRLDPDLSVHVALESVSIPNGLVWVDDGHTALHTDTPTGEIRAYAFDPDMGEFGASRPHIAIPAEVGAPDGCALDADGCLWVAIWGGSAVHRYGPDGTLEDRIALPVSNPTSCAFGGSDGTTLFVTTSQENVDVAAEPLAGRVLAVEVGVHGAPVHAFAG
ncbi:SMP-30/gluconolactonase/LRE family protein [Microbacterium karelineae]|uniref:SMP-30/gluconolactonase/LRE family protein n=1 Tax=Microbacterium karelineae TaxID=2654283 RepID=UPI0012EA16B5|nr:SMP-30/gluconolactonase/LRE family protein [Microbacterium karelineae]